MNVDSEIQDRLSEFERLCVAKSDHKSCAWLFRGGPPLPVHRGHREFSDPDDRFPIYLLDLYHDRHPTLLNLATLKYGHQPRYGIRSHIIFDSNIVSQVHRYFAGTTAHAGQRAAVASFLKFVLREGLDPSPVFYLMESLARSATTRWREYASMSAEAIVDIQTLDRDLFLSSETLATSLRARASLKAHHETEHAQGLIDKYVNSISREVVGVEAVNLNLTYAALLKASLLRLESVEDLSERQHLLGEFMVHELGVVLGLERFLAIAHWAAPERFARLMTPVQKGARPDRVLEKLRSTSWDVYLARLPEQLGKFLAPDAPNEMDALLNLFYIATAEQRLAELVGNRSIELLVQQSDPSHSKIVVGHHADFIESLVGAEEAKRISDSIAAWETDVSRTADQRSQVSAGSLEVLIADLEDEVRIATRSQPD